MSGRRERRRRRRQIETRARKILERAPRMRPDEHPQEYVQRIQPYLEEQVGDGPDAAEIYEAALRLLTRSDGAQAPRQAKLAPDEFTEVYGIVPPIDPTIGAAHALWRHGVSTMRPGERYAEVCRERGERVLAEWEAGGQLVHAYRPTGQMEVNLWLPGEREDPPATVVRDRGL